MGAPAPPQIVGRYAIHGKIASGGMASVHFGRLVGAAGFSRTVAIKKLHSHLAEDPEFLSTMIDEARLAARIHRPNVVPTLDVVSAEGELLVVMEYVRGESLGRLLRVAVARKERVPLPIASAIVAGALHGLHAAHEATNDLGEPLGIVHRDVSPQNILVGVDGQARVIDFGVAKAAGRLQTTRKGVVKGKMSYMSPEQLLGHDVTRQADVYAMAIVLWEVLTGHRLFKAEEEGALFGVVLAGAKDPPSKWAPDLPAELDALVMRGLAAQPAERFATAREMAERLVSVVPPALPPEVGAWVEDVARDALAAHRAALKDVESSSEVMVAAAAAEAPVATRAEVALNAPTIPDRIEVGAVSPLPGVAPAIVPARIEPPPRGRGRLAAVSLAAALLLAAVVVALVWRSGAPAATSADALPSAVATSPVPSAADTPSSTQPGASTSATAVAPPASPPTRAAPTPSTAVTSAAPRAPARPLPRPAPRPPASAPIRFVQPD